MTGISRHCQSPFAAATTFVRCLRSETHHPCPANSFFGRCRPANDTCLTKRSEEHTSELQSRLHLVCRLLLEQKIITLSWCCRHFSTCNTYAPILTGLQP